MKFYWIKPNGANKYHLHIGDGLSLCGRHNDSSVTQPLKEPFNQNTKIDCATCILKYVRLTSLNIGDIVRCDFNYFDTNRSGRLSFDGTGVSTFLGEYPIVDISNDTYAIMRQDSIGYSWYYRHQLVKI